MENVTIIFNSDVHLHVSLDDLDQLFGEDAFEDGFEDAPEDEEPDQPGLGIFVTGLPENIDRKAMFDVVGIACEELKRLAKKAAGEQGRGTHEGV